MSSTVKVQTALQLPLRPKGNYLSRCQKSKLISNLYKVDFDMGSVISIYAVKILPQVTFDATKQVNAILNAARRDLRPYIGMNYIIAGRTIYSCEKGKVKAPKETCTVSIRHGSETYQITVRMVRQVEMSKIYSKDHKEAFLPMNFMNNLMKNLFAEIGYIEIGKTNKYFNPKSRKALTNCGIVLFGGFQTSFVKSESGLYLRADSITRIIQDKTALEHINLVYAKNSHLSKDEKRNLVREQMIGKMVMANYGNSKHWIIEDVLFDVTVNSPYTTQGTSTSLAEYYEKSYGIHIRNARQPILKSSLSKRRDDNNGVAYLIPELLLMSGLPDDFDERRRRQISEHTIIQPEEKLNRIQGLIDNFNNTNENFSPDAIYRSLGVKISSSTQEIESTMLPPPVLQLGRGSNIEQNKVASFALFNRELFKTDVPVNVVTFIPTDYDFNPIEKLFNSTSQNLGIKYTLKNIRLNYGDGRKIMHEIERYIFDADGKYDEFDLNWFIIPPNMKAQYKEIKKMSMKIDNPKVTQVTLTTTLSKKGFASILTKILLQITAKVGNTLWLPKISKQIGSKTMMIGIDQLKDKSDHSKVIVGYSATINSQMSKFYSNYQLESKVNHDINIRDIISDCLSGYGKENNSLPDRVIILKKGCSEAQIDVFAKKEIDDIKSVFKEVPEYKPQLIYVILDKHSKQKFFLNKNRNIANPLYGTLVNTKAVSKNFDFYLISQHCNRGTVKPAYYRVLYNDSNLEEGMIQEFFYVQSFNYMNWSGSIRVPSALQYAEKLVKFVSENINRPPETDQLNPHLYYI